MSIGLHGSPCNAIVEERSQEQGSVGAWGEKECILIKLHSALRKFVSYPPMVSLHYNHWLNTMPSKIISPGDQLTCGVCEILNERHLRLQYGTPRIASQGYRHQNCQGK